MLSKHILLKICGIVWFFCDFGALSSNNIQKFLGGKSGGNKQKMPATNCRPSAVRFPLGPWPGHAFVATKISAFLCSIQSNASSFFRFRLQQVIENNGFEFGDSPEC